MPKTKNLIVSAQPMCVWGCFLGSASISRQPGEGRGDTWYHKGLALPGLCWLSGPSPGPPHVLCALYDAKGWAERVSGAKCSLCLRVGQARARVTWF